MSDTLDLMTPEAIARLRHGLRTPLNQLIGYAGMVRKEARDQSAFAEASLMDQMLEAARQMVEQVQETLPLNAHIAGDAVPALRAALRPWLQRVEKTLSAFEEQAGGACANEVRKMRGALTELRGLARGPAPHRPVPIPRPPKSEPQPGSRKASGRILVVDDDREERQILVRRLEREGYDAVSEPDGEAALARLGRETFDLVLLDIVMPVMDGFQVLSEMKRRLELQQIPVIALSAPGDQAHAVRSIEMGAEDFLSKPYDEAILRARIGATLRRSRAESERAEMAESLQLLLESTGEGVCGEDRDGRCVFVNRAALEMLRCSREDLLGRDLHAAIHHTRPDGSPYPAESCPIASVRRTGEPRRGRETLFRADGTSFPVEFSARPIRRNGRGEGLVVTFTDVTERKRTEQDLLESARLECLGVLAGSIARDCNNHLTGILGKTELVLESLAAGDPNRSRLGEVMAAGERAAELTRQMLDLAGKGKSAIEPMDLSKAIEDVAELLGATLPQPARLKLALSRQLAPIEGDRRQIQQLILNLAIDASQAMGESDGMVTIETGMRDLPAEGAAGAPGRCVYACIHGAGMSGQTGGPGLAAAREIARAHRGAIRVQNESGKGSRVEVLLPATTRVFHMPAAQIGSRTGQTVLVVDDEEVVRQTAGAVLEKRGYRVLLAENGRQAVDIFREHAPEIAAVLLDLTMPVMGGEEAVRQMQAIRRDIPILLSSGHDEEAAARRFSRSRVAGYLRKPYTAKTLLERIRSLTG